MVCNNKHLVPIIKKYNINANEDDNFTKICSLFKESINYQVWALKLFYSHIVVLDELNKFKTWICLNKKHLNKLSKKTFTAYTSKSSMVILYKELQGIEKILYVKSFIERFNTAQRKMLKSYFKIDTITPKDASKDAEIKQLCNIVKKLNSLSKNNIHNFINNCSSLKTIDDLLSTFKTVIGLGYEWTKDSLLEFIKTKTKHTTLVYNVDDVVILKVDSYNDCNLLVGREGRTKWCFNNSEKKWNGYTKDLNRRQYFYFDFSLPESNDYSHIGITVDETNLITNAHSTLNNDLTTLDNKKTVEDILTNKGVDISTFIQIDKPKSYEWDRNSLLNYIKEIGDKHIEIRYNFNNIIIIKTLSEQGDGVLYNGLNKNINHESNKLNKQYYYLFNLNLPFNNSKALLKIVTKEDKYCGEAISEIRSLYNVPITKDFIKTLNISEEDVLSNIMKCDELILHKFIDDNNEKEALSLIKSNKTLNINYEAFSRLPLFSAAFMCMKELFNNILTYNDVNVNALDPMFKEPLLNFLVRSYHEGISFNEGEKDVLKEMIISLFKVGGYNINNKDINGQSVFDCFKPSEDNKWLQNLLES